METITERLCLDDVQAALAALQDRFQAIHAQLKRVKHPVELEASACFAVYPRKAWAA